MSVNRSLMAFWRGCGFEGLSFLSHCWLAAVLFFSAVIGVEHTMYAVMMVIWFEGGPMVMVFHRPNGLSLYFFVTCGVIRLVTMVAVPPLL